MFTKKSFLFFKSRLEELYIITTFLNKKNIQYKFLIFKKINVQLHRMFQKSKYSIVWVDLKVNDLIARYILCRLNYYYC